jgi:flap endonuclease-1
LKWSEPDEEGLVKYLCGDKAFNEDRVRNGTKKLAKARTGTTQGRLDSFFKVLPSTNTASKHKVRAVVAEFNRKFTLYFQTKCSIVSVTLLMEVCA